MKKMILGCLVGMLLGVGMWACQPGSDDDALRGRSGVLLENLSEWICVDSVTPEGYALLCGCQIYGDTMLAGERWKKVYEEGAGMSFLRRRERGFTVMTFGREKDCWYSILMCRRETG